jgi:hypothetical protein
MRRSTYAGSSAGGIELPHVSDYRYAMRRLASLGYLTGCEGVYMEARDLLKTEESQRELLFCRVWCLSRWLSQNVPAATPLRNGKPRAPSRVVGPGALAGMSVEYARVAGDRREVRDPEELMAIIVEIVREVSRFGSGQPTPTTDILLGTLRRTIVHLRALGHDSDPCQHILHRTLTELYKVDFQYLQIKTGPGMSLASKKAVIVAIVDYLGLAGDVWRMIAAHEIFNVSIKGDDIGAEAEAGATDEWSDSVISTGDGSSQGISSPGAGASGEASYLECNGRFTSADASDSR